MPNAVPWRQPARWRIACLIGALIVFAAVAGATADDAAATHTPGHVCVDLGVGAGEDCLPDPQNPGTVGDDVCLSGGSVGGCRIESTQDTVQWWTCVDLIVQERCVYTEARRAAGEPELVGAPTVSVPSVMALIGRYDCIATETALGQREAGGFCRSSSQSRHNFYDCGVLPDHSWCVNSERHSYVYGTATYDGDANYDIHTCVKFVRDDNGDSIARACGYNWVALDLGANPLKRPRVYNGDKYRRKIVGYARF